MDMKSTRKLNNGVEIPLFGLGVFRSADGTETADAVRWALEAGYRHIDTAKIYGNEKSVGWGMHKSGVPRKEIFLTTKLWNDDMRAGRQMKAFEESLRLLETDYVDLYLIHWPVENVVEHWKAMEEIYKTGKARAIGISNFQPRHIDAVLENCEIVPMVNQIEIHPLLSQESLIAYGEERGIAAEAYSPLGGQGSQLMDNKTVLEIANTHGKTPAQVLLRWNLQRNVIVIPKSVKQKRIVENGDLYDFVLTDDEMSKISGLNRDQRFGGDPDNFNF